MLIYMQANPCSVEGFYFPALEAPLALLKTFCRISVCCTSMGKLQVLHGRWMPTFRDRNDVVNDWAEWLRSFDGEVHLLPANTTNVLSLEYHLLVLLISNTDRGPCLSCLTMSTHFLLLANEHRKR